VRWSWRILMNMESEMKERFDKLETLIGKTADGHANLERLIVDVKESLETEMGSLQTEMKAGFSSLNTKLDDNSIRLDRHAGLLRSGGQRIVKLDDWAEKVDKSLETKDREIAELRERVLRLERKKSA
jgi:chromosome segregation ATPase